MIENRIQENSSRGFSVLITGGSGLIGSYLTPALISKGYIVSHLSRNTSSSVKGQVFGWNPEKGIIDPLALVGIDYIIHLAGANIGEKRWSNKRKEEIIKSRVESANLLYRTATQNGIKLKAFISASAVGYYGSISSEKIFTESDAPDDDFLGNTCRSWEEAADQFGKIATRVVKIRTGVVMEKNDSALSKLLKPAHFGVFPRLGSGRQYMPWIHISDLCGIYLKAIQSENLTGAFNAVSPQHITQTGFMRILSEIFDKPFFHPPVPSIFLKTVLGEMSDVVLKGSRISSEKILNTGFTFQFSDLTEALKNAIYN